MEVESSAPCTKKKGQANRVTQQGGKGKSRSHYVLWYCKHCRTNHIKNYTMSKQQTSLYLLMYWMISSWPLVFTLSFDLFSHLNFRGGGNSQASQSMNLGCEQNFDNSSIMVSLTMNRFVFFGISWLFYWVWLDNASSNIRKDSLISIPSKFLQSITVFVYSSRSSCRSFSYSTVFILGESMPRSCCFNNCFHVFTLLVPKTNSSCSGQVFPLQ